MPRTSGVPPLLRLLALSAANLSLDPSQPHLYSGVNYMAGVILTKHCIRVYVEAKIKEAKV